MRTVTERTIPLSVITAVAEALKDTYSASKLRGLFAAAELDVPPDAKMTKVQLCMTCLGWANKHVADPLSAVGQIVGDLMEQTADDESVLEHQKRIRAALLGHQYEYVIGGQIRARGVGPAAQVASVISSASSGKPLGAKRTRQSDTPEVAANGNTTGTEASMAKKVAKSTAPKKGQRPKGNRPTMFIGSTVEALPLARAFHEDLDYDIEVTIWNHGLFAAGQVTWSELVKLATKFDFALFIFSGDDKLTSRKKKSLAIRDNVLIEYGLFVGALGQSRVFFMYNRDAPPKIASDLAGVTPLMYGDRSDGNEIAAISPAANKIRKVAAELGRREQIANP